VSASRSAPESVALASSCRLEIWSVWWQFELQIFFADSSYPGVEVFSPWYPPFTAGLEPSCRSFSEILDWVSIKGQAAQIKGRVGMS
jgi:hypothetical protein